MNRASPSDLRKCAEMANGFIKAGVRFVPMPALSDADFKELAQQADDRIEKMLNGADA